MLGIDRAIEAPAGREAVLVNVALPRGRVAEGTVFDQDTGKPIASAKVGFLTLDGNDHLVDAANKSTIEIGWRLSGPDGRFRMVAPDVPGLLVAIAPDVNYLPVEHANGLGDRTPFTTHGAAPLVAGVDTSIGLRRGRKLEGRALLPDGSPVADGWALCYHCVGGRDDQTPQLLPIHNGRFEVPGCRPGRVYSVIAADRKQTFGAVSKIECTNESLKQPIAVTVAPAATAIFFAVDDAQQPLAGVQLLFEVSLPADQDIEAVRGKNSAVATCWRMAPPCGDWKTDQDGRAPVDGLARGGRYRVSACLHGTVTQTIVTAPADGQLRKTIVFPRLVKD
jgi:hypothetical protein